jgi:transcriptional regulator with XRE-family HTH domain
MSPAQLRAWRKRLDLSQTEAANALGLSLRGYQNYEGGHRRITKVVALACAAVALGLRADYASKETPT